MVLPLVKIIWTICYLIGTCTHIPMKDICLSLNKYYNLVICYTYYLWWKTWNGAASGWKKRTYKLPHRDMHSHIALNETYYWIWIKITFGLFVTLTTFDERHEIVLPLVEWKGTIKIAHRDIYTHTSEGNTFLSTNKISLGLSVSHFAPEFLETAILYSLENDIE